MKITIIGAGNVGSLSAMRIAQQQLGECVLIDIVKGLAQAKAYDLEDARSLAKNHYAIKGTDDVRHMKNSDIVVITAGLTRKPGMTREDLLSKNLEIMKGVCAQVKQYAPGSVVVVVTNPLDLMTFFCVKSLGFERSRVFGMGVSLDASRFANLISKELNVPINDIEASVIGSHGEGMMPLLRLTTIKGIALEEFLDDEKMKKLSSATTGRGLEIVTLLGSGSAYFAPSAAVAHLVRAVAKDEKRTIGVSAYLEGEYGLQEVNIGVPCIIGKDGIEKIVKLELNAEEKKAFFACADKLKLQQHSISL